ncbi:MAG: hypothetical protein GX575_05675 [Candidatus Anammoximicrobium sp.]|nr:hypothetical protein [Candidatus Anammoximicrobium sp.]
MPEKRKTFRVRCLHCGKPSAIQVPRTCVEPGITIRGVVTAEPPAVQRLDDDAGDADT